MRPTLAFVSRWCASPVVAVTRVTTTVYNATHRGCHAALRGQGLGRISGPARPAACHFLLCKQQYTEGSNYRANCTRNVVLCQARAKSEARSNHRVLIFARPRVKLADEQSSLVFYKLVSPSMRTSPIEPGRLHVNRTIVAARNTADSLRVRIMLGRRSPASASRRSDGRTPSR
jgi:hypothetical protein